MPIKPTNAGGVSLIIETIDEHIYKRRRRFIKNRKGALLKHLFSHYPVN